MFYCVCVGLLDVVLFYFFHLKHFEIAPSGLDDDNSSTKLRDVWCEYMHMSMIVGDLIIAYAYMHSNRAIAKDVCRFNEAIQ